MGGDALRAFAGCGLTYDKRQRLEGLPFEPPSCGRSIKMKSRSRSEHQYSATVNVDPLEMIDWEYSVLRSMASTRPSLTTVMV